MDLTRIQEQYDLLRFVEKINKVLKTKIINETTETELKTLSNKISKSIYCIDLKINDIYCEFCQSICDSSLIPLPCSHSICSERCLYDLISYQLGSNYHLYDKVRCMCGLYIPPNIILKAYDSFPSLNYKRHQSALNAEPSINCDICYVVKKISEFLTLECDHRFCSECIKSHIQSNLKQGLFGDKNTCPGCPVAIDHNIIFPLLDENLKTLYEVLSIKNIQLNEAEIFIECPAGCKYAEVISNATDFFICRQCNKEFCVGCRDLKHVGKTCQENAMLNTNLTDPLLKQQFDEGLIKFCPWCYNAVEKDPRGCKYMTCRSSECKSKKWFCFDCLKKLNRFHEKHPCSTPEVETRECLVF